MRCAPSRCCQASISATREKLGAEGTGVEILATRHSRSSPTQNGQRATMQTPQGLDATHGGELFPIDESCRCALVAQLLQLRKNLGPKDGGRKFGLPDTRRAKWPTLSVSDQCRPNFVFEWLP